MHEEASPLEPVASKQKPPLLRKREVRGLPMDPVREERNRLAAKQRTNPKVHPDYWSSLKPLVAWSGHRRLRQPMPAPMGRISVMPRFQELQQRWMSRGGPVRATLAAAGYQSPLHLQGLRTGDGSTEKSLLRQCPDLKPWMGELRNFMANEVAAAPKEEIAITFAPPRDDPSLLARTATGRDATAVHELAGIRWVGKGRAGPSPTQNVAILENAKKMGYQAHRVLESVLRGKVRASIRSSSGETYTSHLQNISAFCSLLGRRMIPARLSTVQLYAGVVNHPSTLRLSLIHI